MTDFKIDENTIIRKNYGLIGLEVDPYGGINITDSGLTVDPFPYAGFVPGLPQVYVEYGSNPRISRSNLANMITSSKLEDGIATVRFSLRITDYSSPFNIGPAVFGPIVMQLPYEARDRFCGLGRMLLRVPSPVLRYSYFVEIDPGLKKIRFLNVNGAYLSPGTPKYLNRLDDLVLFFSYPCKLGTPYLWTSTRENYYA